jgi:predicted DNA-binding transcriptional regulator AlpA
MSADGALPRSGFIRLTQIVGQHGLVPVSRSSWYAGVKAGIYPAGVRIGPNAVAWRRADIDALLARISVGEFDARAKREADDAPADRRAHRANST